ncbi:MAG: type II secretion system protein [Gammaproteobacteria bacterium]|nr:type II secretion system protein [Gammaproteobacteria bacterium]
MRMILNTKRNQGISYVEIMLTVTIAGIIMLALMGVVNTASMTSDTVRSRNDLIQQARFALNRMVDMTSRSHRLLLPLNDNPATNWPENIREQTIPPSPPIGDSSFATAVLAITLPYDIDLDQDGIPDADDDGDGLFDEDLPNDNHHDFTPGIIGIDDDGDGAVDEGADWAEDDEDGSENEDPLDGIDNDGDGSIDEDAPSDMNNDGCSGICGVDDNSNGSIDDSDSDDDDEDSGGFDDPYDPVVYYLNGSNLIERLPARWDTDGISVPNGPVDGRDFIEVTIAENITRFYVERLQISNTRVSIDLILELTDPVSGETVSLQTTVRVGGAL